LVDQNLSQRIKKKELELYLPLMHTFHRLLSANLRVFITNARARYNGYKQ